MPLDFLIKGQQALLTARAYLVKWLASFKPLEKAALAVLLITVITTGPLSFTNFKQAALVETPSSGGTLAEGMVGEPSKVNPLFAPLNPVDRDLVQLVFSGLVKLNEKREIEPDLAERWEITANGQVYTFFLRRDVKWQDGNNFDGKDVVFSAGRLAASEYVGPLAKDWRNVKTELLDDYTVRFHLPSPNALFLTSATVGVLPEHLLAENPHLVLSDSSAFQISPVGTGPYRIVGRVSGQEASLTRFEGYYGSKPYIENIVFKFFNNEAALTAALLQGNLTSGGISSFENLQKLEGLASFNTFQYRLSQYRAVYFNQDANPIFSDISVRQALAFATDKPSIVEKVMHDLAVRVDSPILPGFLGHLSDIRKYEFDPEIAKGLLERANWKDSDNDGVREKDGTKLSFSLKYREDPLSSGIAKNLAANWKLIGVDVVLEPISTESLVPDIVRPRDYHALLFGQTLGADADPYVYWHSSQTTAAGLNLSLITDKGMDNSLENSRLRTDVARRTIAFQDFQKIFADEVPAILLVQPLYTYVVSDKIRGLKEAINFTSASDRFLGVGKWYVKTKLSPK